MTKKLKTLSAEKLNMAIRIAKLYYEQDKTEDEIAKELYISRPTVHRLKKEAIEKGLVKVKVVAGSASQINKLKDSLKRMYPSLKSVHIATGRSPESENHKRYVLGDQLYSHEEKMWDVAVLAGKVFLNYLRAMDKEGIVAVGPGQLNRLVVETMPSEQLDLRIVPTNGYLYERATEYSANQVGTMLSGKIGGKFYWLPCIGILEKAHEPVVSDLPVIRDALNLVKEAQLVLTSVRDFRGSDKQRYETLFRADVVQEYEQGIRTGNVPLPIGLLCDHPFTKDGPWNENDSSKVKRHCVIGLQWETIKKLAKPGSEGTIIIAVMAESVERIAAIRAALTLGYGNVLITDEGTAQELAEPDQTTPDSTVDTD